MNEHEETLLRAMLAQSDESLKEARLLLELANKENQELRARMVDEARLRSMRDEVDDTINALNGFIERQEELKKQAEAGYRLAFWLDQRPNVYLGAIGRSMVKEVLLAKVKP